MNKGKYEAMAPYEMDEMNSGLAADNHLYMERDSGRSDTVAEIVRVIAEDLAKDHERVTLTDTEKVKRIANEYIASCQRTPLLPSKAGLCRALGYSRKGVYLFMRNHNGHATEDFLSRLFDAFSEGYDIAAMGGAIHPVYTIFTQKAQYGLRDNAVEEPPAHDPLGEITSTADLMQKYTELTMD